MGLTILLQAWSFLALCLTGPLWEACSYNFYKMRPLSESYNDKNNNNKRPWKSHWASLGLFSLPIRLLDQISWRSFAVLISRDSCSTCPSSCYFIKLLLKKESSPIIFKQESIENHNLALDAIFFHDILGICLPISLPNPSMTLRFTFLSETRNLWDISYGARRSRNLCKGTYAAEYRSQKEGEPANGQQTEMQKLRTTLELSFPVWDIKKHCVSLSSLTEKLKE